MGDKIKHPTTQILPNEGNHNQNSKLKLEELGLIVEPLNSPPRKKNKQIKSQTINNKSSNSTFFKIFIQKVDQNDDEKFLTSIGSDEFIEDEISMLNNQLRKEKEDILFSFQQDNEEEYRWHCLDFQIDNTEKEALADKFLNYEI